ncbi:MAG TPA: acyltransferase [Gemmatimonadaceae bacterium]|nr:acyltransferase [Gemmatimonadaceae bacterium]
METYPVEFASSWSGEQLSAVALAAPNGVRALARKAASNPGHALRTAVALIRGRWCLTSARLRGCRVRAGRNFRVYGRLHVRGPGEVVFGDDVSVLGRATPWTYSDDARITVGDRVLLGAARFGCVREISIGDDSILADVTITDTDFHSTRARRRHDDAPVRIAPVHIGRNVWLAQHAALLPGASIGENSVVSFGAVCMRAFPANVIIVGNPAKIAGPIPSDVCYRDRTEPPTIAVVGTERSLLADSP